MEASEGRVLRTRQLSKTPESSAVSPKSKRKRREPNSSSSNSSRRRRSTKPNNSGTAEPMPESGTGELKQASSSSGFSISDDEDLPPAVLSSPSMDNEMKLYKKFDIVWIKYRTDEYRPCLITNVFKKHVNFKYINQSRKSFSYRARFHKILRFDDPDQNYKLLNEGRKKCPAIVDAYNRVKHFLCRLSEQKDLKPMKYLFFDKTEDLLYGIIPECETQQEGTLKDEVNDDDSLLDDDEFERPVVENSENEDENGIDEKKNDENGIDENEDDENKDDKNNEQPEKDTDIYKQMTDEEKSELSEKVTKLLEVIKSEDCFNHLKGIVEGHVEVESTRMKLLKDDKEVDLVFKSGLGPFYGAKSLETDQLTDILENYAKGLQFTGDLSLLQRHVLTPEAIIFALQMHCNLERDAAEELFLRFNFEIPKW